MFDHQDANGTEKLITIKKVPLKDPVHKAGFAKQN
jgi:hypothetical protein